MKRKNIKYLAAWMMVTALSVCMEPVNAPAAAYAKIEEGDYKLNTKVKSNMMLDVNGGSPADGVNIQIYQDNYDSYAQSYRISHVKNGWHKICNVSSGKALDVAGGSKKSGANVQLYTYNGSDAQLWRFYAVSGGHYQIQNKLGCYLDVAGGGKTNGTNVCVYTKNTSNAQKWKLINEKQTDIARKTYKINTKLKSGMMLDVAGGSTANDADIRIYHDNDDSMAQQFAIEHVKNGWYKIRNIASDKVADVEGGSSKSGANVRQYTYNGTGAQLWRFYAVSGGYHIRNKQGCYLDVGGGSTVDGANVQVHKRNNTNAQKWKLIQQIPPTKVTLDTSTATFTKMGASRKITAKIAPADATQKTIKWSTSDSRVATVGKDGTVKAAGNGEAVITASTTNGKTAKVQVKVDDGCVEIDEGHYSLNTRLAPDMMLDVAGNGAVDGANVQICAANGTGAQKFYVRKVGNGWYELDNTYPRKCLDVAGGDRFKNGANVQIYKHNGTEAQRWRFYRAAAGYYFIMNQRGRYLDVSGGSKNNGANVVIWDKNGSAAQQWRLVKTEREHMNIANGLYRIDTKVGERLALDVAGGGAADGTNIQIHGYNDSMAQMFTIKGTDGGWYKIVNPFSEKCLDVAGAGTKNGTNVQLHSDNGSDAQKWRFYPSGDGEYLIIKSKLGPCLDVAGGGTKKGTNVAVWEQNGSAAQKWGLTETKIVELTGIRLNSGDFTLKVGDTKNLSVSYEPSNASAAGTAVSWETSNASVARVSNGVVTAAGPGSARIAARSYNGKTAAVTVRVEDPSVGHTKLSYGLYKNPSAHISCGFDRYTTTYGRHEGIDLICYNGAPIYSLAEGVVVRVSYGQNGSNGLSTIAIYDSSANRTVIYLHSDPDTLKVGQHISRGQRIGTQGWRGVSDKNDSHTHVEVRDGRQEYAAKSVGDPKLDNPDPTGYWISKGYIIQ